MDDAPLPRQARRASPAREPSAPPVPPQPVRLDMGGHLVDATAHGARETRLGQQTLICVEGHFSWVASHRVHDRDTTDAGV